MRRLERLFAASGLLRRSDKDAGTGYASNRRARTSDCGILGRGLQAYIRNHNRRVARDLDLERTRKANNDAVESSISLMKYEMATHQKAIANSQKAMEDEIAKFKASVDFWVKAEGEAIQRANKAQADLEALIDRIKKA